MLVRPGSFPISPPAYIYTALLPVSLAQLHHPPLTSVDCGCIYAHKLSDAELPASGTWQKLNSEEVATEYRRICEAQEG